VIEATAGQQRRATSEGEMDAKRCTSNPQEHISPGCTGPRFDLYSFSKRDVRHELALERIIRERVADKA
jgi:hypothetical protein